MLESPPDFQTATAENGVSVLQSLVKQFRSLRYSVLHFAVPHSMFVEHLPRVSFFIVGFHEDAGGVRACRWLHSTLQPVLNGFRASGPPAKLWSTKAAGAGDGVLDPLLKDTSILIELVAR